MPQKNKCFGLIGKSLSHSFSKQFFTEYFRQINIDAVYRNYELSDIKEISNILRDEEVFGLNVTIPYKSAVIPYLDELDDEAKSVGAVNTIRFVDRDGKRITKGYNTDITGFRNSIKPFLKNHHERALILGTGGASKAVAHVLEGIGLDCLFVSRNKSDDSQLSYEELNNYVINSHLLIVNTTPVGTAPNISDKPLLPYEYISEKHLCYDLIYNPAKTAFLKAAEKQGAMIQNGHDMLKIQALSAWKIWNTV
jgi:shikimate dehydrogenase